MAEWVSLRRFARERGVTLGAVQKAIESGRVTAVQRKENGRLCAIDLVEASLQWDSRTDPTEAARSGAPIAPGVPASAALPAAATQPDLLAGAAADTTVAQSAPAKAAKPAAPAAPPGQAAASGEPPASDEPGARDDYLEHRARRESFAARNAEIEFHERVGTLVSAAGVRKAAFETARRVRDQLLGVPDRIAATLAAERDPVRVHQVLTGELKRALNELTRGSTAAGGTGQPA